jgi:hypothetical protein
MIENSISPLWQREPDPIATATPEELDRLGIELSEPRPTPVWVELSREESAALMDRIGRQAQGEDPEIPASSCTPLNASNALIAHGVQLPSLPKVALYGLAGDIVRAIEPHSEADPASILIQALVAAGNVIGPSTFCSVEATRHRLNIFAVLVGESSKARKGTSWDQIKQTCDRVDLPWSTDRVTSGLSSAEGLISELQDSEETPKDKRLLIVQSEFASVLKVMGREGNTLSAALRDAWDHGNLRTLVKREPQRATGAHVSLVGHITKLELLRYLSDTEAHNGFANRLIWCFVRRSKFLPEGGKAPEREIVSLADRLRRVVEWSTTCTEMRRDEAAKKLWAAVYPKLSAGLPGLLGAATSRAEAQVLRISAIYAALDCSSLIRIEHLQAALGLWDYSFASASHIFGDAIGDPVADRIRDALRSAGPEGLTRTEIGATLGRHVLADRISSALNQLSELGSARRETVRGEGRPVEVWIAQ